MYKIKKIINKYTYLIKLSFVFFSNKCLIIVQFVNINISLIIDDSKTAKVTIDLNNADDNYIRSLCEELSNKFSLDEQEKIMFIYKYKM